jgi:hypothetical protein
VHHVHGFDSVQCSLRRVKGAVTQTSPHSVFVSTRTAVTISGSDRTEIWRRPIVGNGMF